MGLHTAPTPATAGHTLRRVFPAVFSLQQAQGCSLAWHLLYRELMKEENHKQAK